MAPAPLIAAAVVAGIGSAVAFEFGVFRPWREQHRHGMGTFAEGIMQEMEDLAEDVKQSLRSFGEEFHKRRQDRDHHRRGGSGEHRRKSDEGKDGDDVEGHALQREIDEFSMHEAQSSGMKSRYTSEFGEENSVRRRARNSFSTADASEDRLVDVSSSSQSNPFADTEKNAQEDLHSPHHHLGEASPSHSIVVLPSEKGDEVLSRTVSRSPDASEAWASPPIETPAQVESGSSADDWHSRTSSRHAHSLSDPDDEGSDSDRWTQLDDSRSPTAPLSPSWTEMELSRDLR